VREAEEEGVVATVMVVMEEELEESKENEVGGED
jgi:hypothetical protein